MKMGEGESDSSESMTSPKVDAARLVRKALDSGSDEKLASALEEFIACCGGESGESEIKEED